MLNDLPGLAEGHGLRDGPFLVEVDLDVGVRLLGQLEDPPGVVVHLLGEVVEGEPAALDGVQHEGQHRLQPGEAGRRAGAALLLDGVGRVVGGDAVDHVQVLPEGLAVLLRHKVRPHLRKRRCSPFIPNMRSRNLGIEVCVF